VKEIETNSADKKVWAHQKTKSHSGETSGNPGGLEGERAEFGQSKSSPPVYLSNSIGSRYIARRIARRIWDLGIWPEILPFGSSREKRGSPSESSEKKRNRSKTNQ
jgi:hypothetical protein